MNDARLKQLHDKGLAEGQRWANGRWMELLNKTAKPEDEVYLKGFIEGATKVMREAAAGWFELGVHKV